MENLGGILATWLRKQKPEKERHPHRLFLSDIGKCPRSIQYRVLGTEKDYKSDNVLANEEVMFSLAEHLEEDLASALAEEGLLWGYQGDVDVVDRENWGGRYDLIADYPAKRIIEVKTLNPNAFRYPIDYPAHRYQAWAYHKYLAESEKLEEYPLLVYFDRGSKANDPQEFVITPQPIGYLMDDLDNARAEAVKFEDVTYERLAKVLSVRSAGKAIKLEPDSRCRAAYCDYFGTCQPDTGESCWAERKDKNSQWNVKKAADPYVMDNFLSTIID